MNLEEHLRAIRRHLHENPELSWEEFESTKFIKQQLQAVGIETRPTNLSTGVFADIVGPIEGPIVALRADIDDLPIEEQTGLPFSSKVKGKMHACGHDFHTTALLGAAHLLKQSEQALKGTVRLIFQPAEETADGAPAVIKDGQLEGVSAIVGLHNKPDLPVGTIGIKSGPLMAGVDRFQVVYKGKGSHAGIPDNGKDPIVAASQLISALQTIVSRNISPLQSAVVSVTRIEGGSTWNVIPGEVVLEGTVRTFDPIVRKETKERFYTIVKSIASAFLQEAEINWIAGPPPLINEQAITEVVRQAAVSQGLHVIEPAPSMAGEDYSNYLEQIPGTFAFFGTSGTEEWHHPSFTLDERAIMLAANFLSESARRLLAD